jgi:hypothetical protein
MVKKIQLLHEIIKKVTYLWTNIIFRIAFNQGADCDNFVRFIWRIYSAVFETVTFFETKSGRFFFRNLNVKNQLSYLFTN